jgi:hypothetical protein
MQYPARTAAARIAAGSVWSELAGERQAQVVALLVRLAMRMSFSAAARRGTASGAVRAQEEGNDGVGQSIGKDPE